MAAPKGNNFNRKWNTQEERRAAFQAVCDHLSAGYSKASFPLADWDTVEAYCAEFPEDFPSEKLREAMRGQRFAWETIGLDGVQGKIDGFNATAWIFNMKNRFREDWNDRSAVELTGKDGGPVQTQDVPASQRLLERLSSIEARIAPPASE